MPRSARSTASGWAVTSTASSPSAAPCRPSKYIKIENSGSSDPTVPVFTDQLTRLPGVHHIIVVGINDESVEGAIDAARTANRLADIYVSGQGLDNSAYCLVKTYDHWMGDTAYFPEHYGLVGVPYLIKLAKGQ